MEHPRQDQEASHEATARLAYQLWEQRGHPEGRDVEFWLEAEQQILSSNQRAGEKAAASTASAAPAPSKAPLRARSRAGGSAPLKAERDTKPVAPRPTFEPGRQTKPTAGVATRP